MLARQEIVRKYIATALCLLCVIGFVQAETVEPPKVYAEGVAAIVLGDRDAARQRALADALNQASLSMGARVMSTERLNAGDVPLQSQQIRPIQRVAKYSIVKEWEDTSAYHVAISAEVKWEGDAAESMASLYAVKKKVAFTQFDVASTIQVDDINNIYDGLPIELSRRLESGGGFLANYVSGSIPRDNDALQQKAAMRIAREAGAQFLISGLVLDASISQEDGIFGTSLGRKIKRNFKIELAIHDGLTGARLLSHRIEDEAQGEVKIGNDKPFGSSDFYETDSGRALKRLIDVTANKIRATLACLPFSTHVVRVEGKLVYLDAGATSMLKVGDRLALYITDYHSPIVGAGGAMLGVPERPVTTVTLIKIQPMLSIGELPEDTAKYGVKAGSIARFEFLDSERSLSDCLH